MIVAKEIRQCGASCRRGAVVVPDWMSMTTAEKTALVLAGGGTKGAFEAGAVKYLVEEESLTPQVITSTSAGSICAIVLAQARGHLELLARVGELHDDLLAMTHTELLFGKQPWVDALDGTLFGAAIEGYVTVGTRPPIPGETGARYEGPTRAARARRRIDLALDVLKALPHVRRARRHLKRSAGSLFTLDPLAAALRSGGPTGITPVDPVLVARPGLELRMAVVALGAGVLRYVTEDGTLVESDAVTPVGGGGSGPVDVIEGVLASASVPMIFPPRPMADDAYADGGVADVVPVTAAARLGATRIFAVLAVPLLAPRDTRDFTKVSGLGVFLRSIGVVAFAERQQANLHPPMPPGIEVTVIDPVVDVVGPFEVSQGLMLLDMDYGWMRAADVLANLDRDTRRRAEQATDAVALARTRAWHLEEAIWGTRRAGSADLAAVTDCKLAVRDAVCERKGLGLPTPPDAERWWSGYEAHRGPRPACLPVNPLALTLGN